MQNNYYTQKTGSKPIFKLQAKQLDLNGGLNPSASEKSLSLDKRVNNFMVTTSGQSAGLLNTDKFLARVKPSTPS